MHTVILTPTLLRQALSEGLSDDDLLEIAARIANAPLSGDIIQGTGGDDVPVFLLAIYGKSSKANLSKSERNELSKLLPRIAMTYRMRGANIN